MFLTLKVESLVEPKFDPNFSGQNDSIFSLSALKEKNESF